MGDKRLLAYALGLGLLPDGPNGLFSRPGLRASTRGKVHLQVRQRAPVGNALKVHFVALRIVELYVGLGSRRNRGFGQFTVTCEHEDWRWAVEKVPVWPDSGKRVTGAEHFAELIQALGELGLEGLQFGVNARQDAETDEPCFRQCLPSSELVTVPTPEGKPLDALISGSAAWQALRKPEVHTVRVQVQGEPREVSVRKTREWGAALSNRDVAHNVPAAALGLPLQYFEPDAQATHVVDGVDRRRYPSPIVVRPVAVERKGQRKWVWGSIAYDRALPGEEAGAAATLEVISPSIPWDRTTVAAPGASAQDVRADYREAWLSALETFTTGGDLPHRVGLCLNNKAPVIDRVEVASTKSEATGG